ncbi:MAG: hypothetical protein AAFR90_13755 [Pseudomonadota bacterium]
MSDRRIEANRANATKSTGPKSQNGKAAVSNNATQHGIFSSRLFLDDEDPADYEHLQIELRDTLMPVGALEFGLVERIAVNMWRQRRLIAAETSAISLEREAKKIADGVSSELGVSFTSRAIQEEQLEPFDKDQERWCNAVVEEIELLEDFEPANIEAKAPHIFGQLKRDAEDNHEDEWSYLKEYPGGPVAYIAELRSWCRTQIADAKMRPKLLDLAERIRQERLVLPESALMLFTRYQTTLDNQIYKALKALREAQDWRLKSVDASAADISDGDQAQLQ